jgi:hypothetical protein
VGAQGGGGETFEPAICQPIRLSTDAAIDVQSARKTIQLCYGFVGALVLRSLPVTVRCAFPAVRSEPRLIIPHC